MKVTVEVDCTPDEARAFLGLPDVKPMQVAVMANIEKQMIRGSESFTPDAMLKMWFTTMPQVSSHLQDMFARVMGNGKG